jgi:hypothetical protein
VKVWFGFAATCFAVALTATALAASAGPKANLMLASTAPVKVVGTHFKIRESVKVTLSLQQETFVRQVRATSRGTFTVRFDGARIIDRCSAGLRITAVGARGSRAAVKLPQPLCPPALSPP